ncbi:uncharacterized protein LOC112904882 [Agrilus planipennis]|uniref:Uncharacterized protein LOC112904882 n=1 Tax=Agrilus planipennis TaxID=224129 RepID=A0A7F5R759_AGRPL|nr:uncharacterized protein LOC112904882 [Agrilus planipennis]
MNGKVYKSWGSADNLAPENSMPAPKGFVKRKSKKMLDSTGANSTPGTPNQMPRSMSHSHRSSTQDSDSDTAAGFDSNWRP